MSLLKIGEVKIKPTKLNPIGSPYYVFSESLDSDIYNDITTNENWMTIGMRYYDYMFCRNQIIQWTYVNTTVAGKSFSGLTQGDQEWAVKTYSVGSSERDSVYTQDEQLDYWGDFISNASVCRSDRWSSAKSYVSFNLSTTDSIDIAKTTNTLTEEYITYGIEEYSADGVTGLFDWIEDTGSFSGSTGFGSKSYYTTGLTSNIMIILRDGIY